MTEISPMSIMINALKGKYVRMLYEQAHPNEVWQDNPTNSRDILKQSGFEQAVLNMFASMLEDMDVIGLFRNLGRATSPEDKFRIGDIVRIKGFPIDTTVIKLIGKLLVIAWFSDGKLNSHEVHEDAVVLMSRLDRKKDNDVEEKPHIAAVTTLIGDPDGCSDWKFFTLSNGDVIFGCYPQGDLFEKLTQSRQLT